MIAAVLLTSVLTSVLANYELLDADSPRHDYFLIGERYEVSKSVDDCPVLRIFSDHTCIECLNHLRKDADRIQNFRIVHSDQSERPANLRKWGLPVAYWQQNGGTWYAATYTSADDFRATVLRLRVPKSADKRMPVSRGGYVAKSYDWRIVGGESETSLRQHLSKPSQEHHSYSFDPAWLQTLTYRELVGLHSDSHNGRIQWQYIPKKTTVKPVRGTYCPTCPR